MWPDVASVRTHASPDAVAGELRTQIETALAAGIDVTHLDHHMGAAVAPEFVATTAEIASDYGLPLMLPAQLATFYDVMDQPPADISAAEEVRDSLAAAGRIVVDRFLMGLSYQDRDPRAVNREFVADAAPGVTFLSFHCAVGTDIAAIHPHDAAWRLAEDALFRDDAFVAWAAGQNVELIGFRGIRDTLRTPFVPEDFTPPVRLDGPGFRLEPLGPHHNERDHAAWMASIDHIRTTPGFDTRGRWPAPMSLAENLADLERHAHDFATRKGFTYSIIDDDNVIGCLYIYPPRRRGSDAEVRSWVSAARAEMDVVVWRAVAEWLASAWPFDAPRYAARD